MSSLLSPFHFGQKYAYFHAHITIHELANVPLVDGSFKARWRVKNSHHLQSLPASQGEDGSEEGDRRSLHHKKSFASSIASQEVSSTGKDSPKLDQDEKGLRERKISHRFLSGFKDVLHNRNRRPSSSGEPRQGESSEDQPVIEHREKQHPKGDSYDSIALHRPKRTSSFNDAASVKAMSSLSNKTLEDEKGHFHPSSLLQMEPRGETMNEKIKEHSIKWEKTIDVGVRIPIIKNSRSEKSQVTTASGALMPSSGHSAGLNSSEGGSTSNSSAAPGNRTSMSSSTSDQRNRHLADYKNSEGESRADKLDREVKEKDKDREMTEAWGMLGNTELKVTVKADISTDRTHHHKEVESHVTMGYIIINLAELAPYPETHAHHHHHHNHSHHQPTLYRADTRRYLLIDSRNNATLKVTIEMTHAGGTKEYGVPAARRGLVVASPCSLIHDIGGDSSSNSEADHSGEIHLPEVSRPGLGEYRYSGFQNESMTSFKQDPITSWPSNSVARHGRIPSSNLKTELSHQDAARAVKEAGGQRMGFSFGAGAHHERPPEDVIEGLFNQSSLKSFSQTLAQSGSRQDRSKSVIFPSSSPPKKRVETPKEESSSQQQANVRHAEKAVNSEKPPHFSSLKPAEDPRDSAQSRGEPLSRLPSEPGASENQPGPDFGQTPDRKSSKSSADNNDDYKKPSQHRRNSSNGTVKSILTTSKSPKVSQGKNSASNMARSISNNGPESPESSNLSSRVNLVHWDASVSGNVDKEGPPSLPIPTPGLTIPIPHMTASPSLMSRDMSEDSLYGSIPKRSSLKRTTSSEGKENNRQNFNNDSFGPPDLNPDSIQKKEFISLNGKGASRGTKGLTKEEALKQGYRGAGWGTMTLLWPYSKSESSDHPLDVYTESNTPHLTQSRDNAVQ